MMKGSARSFWASLAILQAEAASLARAVSCPEKGKLALERFPRVPTKCFQQSYTPWDSCAMQDSGYKADHK